MTHLLIALAFVVTIIVPSFVATNGLSTKKERTINLAIRYLFGISESGEHGISCSPFFFAHSARSKLSEGRRQQHCRPPRSS